MVSINIPAYGALARSGIKTFRDYQATGDGSADDTARIQAAIDETSAGGGGVLLGVASDTYKIVGVITLKDDVIIDLRGATLFFSTTTSGIKTQSTWALKNGILSAVGVSSYVGPALLIDDNDGYVRTSMDYAGIEDIVFRGPGQSGSISGTAIKLHGNGGTGITKIAFDRFRIDNFTNGIHIYAETSWINNCNFSDYYIFGCNKHVYIQDDGSGAGGHLFIGYSHQSNSGVASTQRSIVCEGDYNVFQGRSWDWETSGASLAVEFVSNARNNVLCDITSEAYVSQAASDASEANHIFTASGTMAPPSVGTFAPPSSESYNFLGNADDCLAFASSRLTVTASGDSVTGGAWSNVFVPDSSAAVWSALDSATVKIDFGASQSYLFGVGVLFGFAQIADNILIEYSSNDSDYTTLLNATGNENFNVSRVGKSFYGSFRYIRITVSNDAPKATNISRIYAFTGNLQGQAWLSRIGGTLYGDLIQRPGASVAPVNNGEVVVEFTNNTTLTFKAKGSDGTVRSGTVTLS